MSNRTYYTAQILQDEQFMQFPKWLMQDSEFSKLSNDAKVLYCMLKDRFKLSAKNHWIDKEGRVFIVCKRESMATMLNCSKKTAIKIFNELIDTKLVDQKHNGLNKPNYIYLLMPELSVTPDVIFEEDDWVDEDLVSEKEEDKNNNNSRKCKNYTSEGVKITPQEVKKIPPNKNKLSNNKFNNISLNNNNEINSIDLDNFVVVINQKINKNELTKQEKNLLSAKMVNDKQILQKYQNKLSLVCFILQSIAPKYFRMISAKGEINDSLECEQACKLLLKTLTNKRYKNSLDKLDKNKILNLFSEACDLFNEESNHKKEIHKSKEAYFVGITDNILNHN